MAHDAPETSMADPKRRVAIVLLAHGARDERWAEPFHRVTAAVRVAAPDSDVELAFLELMAPDLESAVHRLAAAGASSIRVIPLFFGQGGHLRKDVPAIVAGIAQSLPGVAAAERRRPGTTRASSPRWRHFALPKLAKTDKRLCAGMARDDVGSGVDEVQRLVQHRQCTRGVAGSQLILDLPDSLAQLLFIGFGAFELAGESREFVRRFLCALFRRHAQYPSPICTTILFRLSLLREEG
jgi:sirohydrochlorin cobaltochelatase